MIRYSIAVSLLFGGVAHAQNGTTAGTPTSSYPTIQNLSIDWAITGDDDLDGVVTVRFRQQGTTTWHDGMPLRRVPADTHTTGWSWENKHSGSIFGLLPDTTYEIELSLDDPDGGSTVQTINATTRPVPLVPASATIFPVDAGSFSASDAQAGRVVLLAAGDYSGFTISQSGTEGNPVVIRAEEPGTAIITGDVRMDGEAFVYLEGLVINGMVKFNNAEGIVIRGCTINTDGSGIVSMSSGVTNGYFCDNVVLGVTPWTDAASGAGGDNIGEGIQITGPGSVICHNFVKGFRDAISTLEDSGASNQVSIDVLYNDIEIGADDAIETDFTMGNTRVMYNRISNSYMGVSGQPTLGGPLYIVRNVMYNIVYSPFKLHRGSMGDVALHNTVVKCGDAFAVPASDPWGYSYFRNNLLIGGEGGGTYGGYGNGSGRVTYLPAAQSSCDFDYDGFGAIGVGFSGNIGGTSFNSLSEMQSTTTEVHAVEVDMSVFADAITFPASGPYPERPIPDMRLASGSAAEDVGMVVPNINDGYAGSAPDLGAYELGDALPIYGPRPGKHFDYPSLDDVAPAAPSGLVVQ